MNMRADTDLPDARIGLTMFFKSIRQLPKACEERGRGERGIVTDRGRPKQDTAVDRRPTKEKHGLP